MTDHEAVARIVSAWMRDVPPVAIMMHLICLGYPVRKAEVLAVIKAYIDSESENRSPHI